MQLVVMQPTYLPWAGYFALMAEADCFVFLDNVPFSKQSWQQRTRIKTANGVQWLTVPVLSRGKLGQRILEVEPNERTRWREKHVRSLRQAYGKAPFWKEHREWLESLYAMPVSSLRDLNEGIIRELAVRLGLSPRFVRASEMDFEDGRVDRLLALCRALGADAYLSPLGSLGYIREDNRFPEAGIDLRFQNFTHPRYPQLHGDFQSHMSVIDLLLNTGPEALSIIRSGVGPGFALEEAAERADGP